MAGLTGLLHRLTARQLVLPSYYQEPTAIVRAARATTLFGIAVIAGLFYGLALVLLPPILLLYVSFPIVVLAGLVLWAMPDARNSPTRLLFALLIIFSLALVLWPDYVAIQIPGFAWITFRRIFSWAMAATLLLCLALSSSVRRRLRERVALTRPFWIMAALYFAWQWITLPMTQLPFRSVNTSLNNLLVWGVPLLTATCLFDSQARIRKWEVLLFCAGLINCVIALLEAQNREVLWAHSIPAFLTVEAETLQNILDGAIRDGKYRSTSVFTVSLCLAEFLAVLVPFALRRAFATDRLATIFLWLTFDVALWGGIFLTHSRLGIIGWLVSHVVFVALWGWKRWLGKANDIIGAAVSFAFPFGALALLTAMFTVPAVYVRTIGGGSTSFSDRARQDQFHLFWPKFAKNPLGYGSGQSGIVLDYHLPGGQITVDSYFITTGIDFGIVGLICFFGMFFYTFYLMGKSYLYSETKEGQMALGVAGAIAVLFMIRLVLSQSDNVPLIFIVFGIAIALYANIAKLPDTRHPDAVNDGGLENSLT